VLAVGVLSIDAPPLLKGRQIRRPVARLIVREAMTCVYVRA